MPVLHFFVKTFFLQAPKILAGLLVLTFSFQAAFSAARSDRTPHMVQCNPKALKILFNTAFKGDTQSQYALYLMYASGHCLEKNMQKSTLWLKTAAHHGHPEALYTLADAYQNGKGVDKDIKRSNKLFLRAAENGHINAQHQLGMNLLRAQGSRDSRDEGLYWLGYAAANGHALSALVIGRIHERGSFGIDKNECLARDWYEAGILLGEPVAHTLLAQIDQKGPCI